MSNDNNGYTEVSINGHMDTVDLRTGYSGTTFLGVYEEDNLKIEFHLELDELYDFIEALKIKYKEAMLKQ